MRAPKVRAPRLSWRRPVSAHRAVGEAPPVEFERAMPGRTVAVIVLGGVLLVVDGVLLWSAIGELASW